MNVKVMGYLRCAREVAPAHDQAQGWGRIINISGLAARQTGTTVGSMRNVAVAGADQEPRRRARPARHQRHRASIPGLTRTEKHRPRWSAQAEAQGIARGRVEKRMADGNSIRTLDRRAEEIAHVVAFLASPKSVAINGDAIAAGGGAPRAIHY